MKVRYLVQDLEEKNRNAVREDLWIKTGDGRTDSVIAIYSPLFNGYDKKKLHGSKHMGFILAYGRFSPVLQRTERFVL